LESHIEDSGGKCNSYWQDNYTLKSSSYNSGQLNPQMEVACKLVVQILKRLSNESILEARQFKQKWF
jgi:hypothetical protein